MSAARKSDAAETPHVLYDEPRPHVARITLNRPEVRNAQGIQMTYELDAAFKRAAHDSKIHVVILAAAGKDFSSGHDLSFARTRALETYPLVSNWGEFEAPGQEGSYGREKEIYLEMTERWRNVSKPTIAQVQGRCIAGGLMLAWACDLLVATEDAQFLDTTPTMGIPCAEFFNHPYELGVRKAKEWLFTAEWLSAAEGHRLGMINHVVPRVELEDFTLKLAERIAMQPLFALKLIKEAVNNAQDLMGRRQNNMFTFALHHMAHSHYQQLHNFPIAVDRLPPKLQEQIREAQKSGAMNPSGKGD